MKLKPVHRWSEERNGWIAQLVTLNGVPKWQSFSSYPSIGLADEALDQLLDAVAEGLVSKADESERRYA